MSTGELKLVSITSNNKTYSKSVQAGVVGALLDVTKIPKIVGVEQRKKAAYLLDLIEKTKIPIICVGDSGTGKTATMKAAAKVWSSRRTNERYTSVEQQNGARVPVYYVQLDSESTKTSLFLGHRMIAGSLEIVKGVLAVAAEQGAIVLMDEIGHANNSIITLFNAFDGAESTITIGDTSIDATNMKIIYGTNASSHAGNTRLAQSFVNRVVSLNFDYPSFDDEYVISLSVAKKNIISGIITVPESVCKYIMSFVRETRTPTFPLSVRNISNAIILCQLAPILNQVDVSRNKGIEKHFTTKSNATALQELITRRIYGEAAKSTHTMSSPEVIEFIEFVSKIGLENFKEIIKSAINFYVDIEGLDVYSNSKRNEINSNII